MSCSTAHQGAYRLHCYFPVADTPAFAVYFSPKSGHERMVVNCMQSDEFECDNENGFILEQSASNHADIKLPEHFIKESGSFRCQIPGFSAADVKTCLWPPTELPADGNITAGIRTPKTTEKYALEDTSGNSQSIGVGVGVGVGLLASIILISVVIVLIKRFVLRKKEGIKDKGKPLQYQYEAVTSSSKEGHYYPLSQSDTSEKDQIRNDPLWTLSDTQESYGFDLIDVLTNEQTPGNEEVHLRLSERVRQEEPTLYYKAIHSIKAQTRKEAQDGNSKSKEENWDSTEEDLSQEDTTPSYLLDVIKDRSGDSDEHISTTEGNDVKNLLTSGLKEDLIGSSPDSEKSVDGQPPRKGANFM